MSSLFILFQRIVPQHLLSRFVGFFAESQFFSRPFIYWFKQQFDVDLSEAEEQDPRKYPTFNAFFTRPLKSGARPIPEGNHVIVSPADGAVSQAGSIDGNAIFQAKGHSFSVKDLLACDDETAKKFEDGVFCTVYLSPRDYHRVHMPFSGNLISTTYIPGQLFSVNQKTAESISNLFARNERLVCLFETKAGTMALVLVGAMIVAGIETVWGGHVCPKKSSPAIEVQLFGDSEVILKTGDEVGRFKLGSTAIVLFEKESIALNSSMTPGAKVRMGEFMATQTS